MREIKFRAWDKGDDNYLASVGMLPLWGVTEKEILVKMPASGIRALSRERVELMQYTGLKDKNSKEIYEGDIARTPYRSRMEKGVVSYVGSSFVFIAEKGDTFTLVFLNELPEFEVIGNIYENPELLE